MGTYVVVTVRGHDRAGMHRGMDAAFAAMQAVDGMMSLHKPDSELARLNSLAYRQPVVVSSNLFHVIQQALAIARRTSGAFDPTLRPLVDLWGFLWKDYRLPHPRKIRDALARVGHEWVELDEARRSVRFLKEGLSIDLGGIAKGYAVDRAVETLRALGWTNAMVRAGGDLRVMGSSEKAAQWEVQLEDPAKGGARTRVYLGDAALSTSGSYENFFEIDGRRYSHLLDPRTGWPVEGVVACTVTAPTCLESDAWATAAFVMGPERFLRDGPYPARFTLPGSGDPEPFRTVVAPLFPASLD
jgi:thiamine biosynthesis lipoprotein